MAKLDILNHPSVKRMAQKRGPEIGQCKDCPVRDICPLEFDGNANFNEAQAHKALYVMFQFDTIGAAVDIPEKELTQTQPWTLNDKPQVPNDMVQMARLLGELSGVYPIPQTESTGAVSPNVPANVFRN